MDDPERIARDAAACQQEINGTAPPAPLYCEGTFDSWLCWPPTPANTTAYRACPDFVPGFSPDRACPPRTACDAAYCAALYRTLSCCSIGAQRMHCERHVVAASADWPALVQLHHLRQAGGCEGYSSSAAML